MNLKIVPTADGSNTLFSEQYGETFHSVNGAVTEARHVFLEAGGVRQRLESNSPTRILEIGFGLGLNCLLSVDLAINTGTRLDYHAVEATPISAESFQVLGYEDIVANKDLPETLGTHLLADRQSTQSEFSALSRYQTDCHVTLHTMDATRGHLPAGPFDAIFLDPFSPDTNPECWTVEFLHLLYPLLSAKGIMTTYSAKGSVRRSMELCGFSVNKVAGPPGKREMIIATRP